MKKQLPKPENWQDFESLCKKLWGEMWKIPNKIKKNGRSGQTQHGVDIYGIPKNENGYWGIQCKGKDLYTNAKLTKIEIDTEVEKAKEFKPELKVFIFATTSNKDASIEEYIRLKDIENNSFEILLYCWEDIVDLIEENREVYNYFMESQKYKTEYDFEVFINDFENKTHRLIPEFYNTQVKSVIKPPIAYNPRGGIIRDNFINGFWDRKSSNNLSYCSFDLLLTNTGNKVLENWKIQFELEGECEFLGNYNKSIDNTFNVIANPNAYESYDNKKFSFNSLINPLIQKDNIKHVLWIRPLPKEYELKLHWKFLARDYNKDGTIILYVSPKIEKRVLRNEVEHLYELKEDSSRIDEKIEYK